MAYTTIDKPTDYFNTILYTGTGSNSNSVTGVGFQPDWLWLKSRSNAYPNFTYDAVRTNRSALITNSTNAEDTGASNQMTSLNSDGFTVVDSGDSVGTNDNGATFVSWNWKAGTSFTNDASSTSIGSIDSTGSVNTDAGFSIVSFTGNSSNSQTVAHGLGVAPSMVIIKNRVRSDEGWWTQHTSFAAGTHYALLNSTSAAGNAGGTNIFNGFPTSTVFKINDGRGVNENGSAHIAYCFAGKQGYSKFGSYVGNGNADGTFVYTGFKPAFFMIKRTTGSGYDWLMYDNKRQVSFNVVDDFLKPNLSDAETTGNANQSLDFLSNGVKHRGNGASSNGSGASYIYMAFAENPFVTSSGVPATAR